MLNLMIVDDEAWVCELLKGITDWKKLGFNLISEAYEGQEAFSLIKLHKPDVVITDIRMPGMDGISLMKHTKELGSEDNENSVFKDDVTFKYADDDEIIKSFVD